jgi:chromatin assembly factor 1 subunit A
MDHSTHVYRSSVSLHLYLLPFCLFVTVSVYTMDEIESLPPSPNPRKRPAPDQESPEKRPLNLKGTQFMPTPPDTDGSSNASPTYAAQMGARRGSPAPSSSTLTSVEITGSNTVEHPASTAAGNASSNSTARPAKRRKLTPAEKEQKRLEKEAKDAEKAAQKVKRDEEKRIKDEEKRKKAEERDAKKREKEVEEERKFQDKMKKERSQMRLGVFFQKSATPAKPDDSETPTSTARRKSLSLEPFDAVADQIRRTESPCKGPRQPATQQSTPAQPTVSDYKKYFLPFQLQSNQYMAPSPAIDHEQAQADFDEAISDPSLQEKYDLGPVDAYASLERQFGQDPGCSRGIALASARQLVDHIQGTLQQPIDLTQDETPANPITALHSLSRRYLEFDEDVRPAYFGTYTKIRSPRTMSKMCRDPLYRGRKDTDYGYDSEAEWEEPEEGDDECIDDEDEAESQPDVGEMDEFLDDEDDAAKTKRKMITGDLQPASIGICWEDAGCRIVRSIENDPSMHSLQDMRIGVLLPNFHGCTIDPFSTKYWDEQQPSVPQVAVTSIEGPIAAAKPSSTMPPPRSPLQPRDNTNATLDHMLIGAAEGMKGPITSVAATQSTRGRPKVVPKALSKEDLDEFKDAVVGSQISKADLLKGLKKR